MKLNLSKNHQLRSFIIIYTIAFIWWIGTIIYREILTKSDILFLRRSYFCAPKQTGGCKTFNCNGWCVGHFFNYVLLGFFAPKYLLHAIVIGALFEIFELFVQNATMTDFVDAKVAEDVLTNSAGAVLGYLLSPYRV